MKECISMLRTLIFLSLMCCCFTLSEDISFSSIAESLHYSKPWRVLEGVTEPFKSHAFESESSWIALKLSADQKSKSLQYFQALNEYGQLVKQVHYFSKMPSEEKYDVFLSMSKLFRVMGYHQRAENVLYEAMSYSSEPFEAHFQLGIISLEKEDLEKSKIHFKNCLLYKDSDVGTLVHLTIVLIAQGKLNEAKFFTSRILVVFENILKSRGEVDVDRFKTIMLKSSLASQLDHSMVFSWIEDLFHRVFFGDFRVATAPASQLYRMFSHLYLWICEKEFVGRLVFDLGQSLYEKGKPVVARSMMRRGNSTADINVEGIVSKEVISLRLAFDFPIVSDSVCEIMESYFNMTYFLSQTASTYVPIDLENFLDVSWSLPLLSWASLPVASVFRELHWRFKLSDFCRNDSVSLYWLRNLDDVRGLAQFGHYDTQGSYDHSSNLHESRKYPLPLVHISSKIHHRRSSLIRIAVFGGHMNSHPVGQSILLRLLAIISPARQGTLNGRSNSKLHLTLLACPLASDDITAKIAQRFHRVINLPVDVRASWKKLTIPEDDSDDLHFDIVLYPDWQPFPDQLAMLYQQIRLAPVQICFYVRGMSCSGSAIDYYLIPQELSSTYERWASPGFATTSNHPIFGQSNDSLLFSNKNSVHTSALPSQSWMVPFSEQVVQIQWPILTPSIIQEVFQRTFQKFPISSGISYSTSVHGHAREFSGTSTSVDSSIKNVASELSWEEIKLSSFTQFSPLESEGQLFFQDQPVAVIACFPQSFHPLMDDTIVKFLQAQPLLHLILVIPDTFMMHTSDTRQKMSWARRLVRRLWTRSGNHLSHRIRLLPAPLSDQRLLQLFRQADLLLDTFPVGTPFDIHSLSLSVGTPVITFDNGVVLSTPSRDLSDIRSSHMASDRLDHHPMMKQLLTQDIPWRPTSSNLAGFYKAVGIDHYVVAKSPSHYIELANTLISNRELSYEIRVRLLEVVDGRSEYHGCEPSVCGDDLRQFLVSIGREWADIRTHAETLEKQKKPLTDKNPAGTKQRRSRTIHDIEMEDNFAFQDPSAIRPS